MKNKHIERKNPYYGRKVEKSLNTQKSTWNVINTEVDQSKNKNTNNICLRVNNEMIVDPKVIGEILNNYYYFKVFKETTKSDSVQAKHIHNFFHSFTQDKFECKLLNRKEICKIVSSLKNTFSTGYDDIPHISLRIVKRAIEYLANPLLHFVNSCFYQAVFLKKNS